AAAFSLNATAGRDVYVSNVHPGDFSTSSVFIFEGGSGRTAGLASLSGGDLIVDTQYNSQWGGGINNSLLLASTNRVVINQPVVSGGANIVVLAADDILIASDLQSATNMRLEANDDGGNLGGINQTGGTVSTQNLLVSGTIADTSGGPGISLGNGG